MHVGEVVTRNTDAGPLMGFCNWNGRDANAPESNNQRASLVPAAAVIPALIVYTKIAAVKKLVVGLWGVFFRNTKKK